MGILSSLLKYVSWGQIASLAMEYGPQLLKQAREKLDAAAHPTAAETELRERIERLEKLLLEQENVISEQKARSELLEENCRILEAQLGLWKIVTGVSIGITLAIFVLLIMRW